MKGLEVAERFFREWGLPYLEREFPDVMERAAAGLFRGSQVFGADDELSKDHGWGPMFSLILCEEDYDKYGIQLTESILAAAPNSWSGYTFQFPRYGIDVISIDRFFNNYLGFAFPPDDWNQWLTSKVFGPPREYELYILRHCQVFYDPSGMFTDRLLLFRQYPEKAKIKRITEELFNVWHYGQYNYLDRLSKRNEPVAAIIARGHFTESVMRLWLLLDNDFTPYWKWLSFEFRKHASAQKLDNLLTQLSLSQTLNDQVEIISVICDIIHLKFVELGMASDQMKDHPHPLFRNYNMLLERLDKS